MSLGHQFGTLVVGFALCSDMNIFLSTQDDQQCVLARAHGKKVVSELWVDDSLDRRELADADRVSQLYSNYHIFLRLFSFSATRFSFTEVALFAFWQALYWPVREFNGIPGAESLVICLTGFQKRYREDITVLCYLYFWF